MLKLAYEGFFKDLNKKCMYKICVHCPGAIIPAVVPTVEETTGIGCTKSKKQRPGAQFPVYAYQFFEC